MQNADHVERGAFMCRTKELLNEMISAATKRDTEIIASMVVNNQCSIADKKYKVSMIDSGILTHKIRLYDDRGKNFVVWIVSEDYFFDKK